MTKKQLSRGLIQVYTGDGKGKTTCALGLALRTVGQGLQVYVVQFLKGRETGEFKATARLSPEMTWRDCGRPGLVNLKSPAPGPFPRLTATVPAIPRPRPGSGTSPRR
jgi:cob(I)alamin adenosyltransferase